MNKKQVRFAEELNRVIAWIIDNPDTDPNAYEMCSLYLKAAEFRGSITEEIRENLAFMDRVRMQDFKNRLDVSLDHPLFELIATLYDNAVNGVVITEDPIAKEAICKIAGIFLYIVQEQRKNPGFSYSNQAEFRYLSAKVEYCEIMDIFLPHECEEMFAEIESQISEEE